MILLVRQHGDRDADAADDEDDDDYRDDDDSNDDDHHHAAFAFARQADPSPHQIIQRLFMNPPHLFQLLVRIKCIILIIIMKKEYDDNGSDDDEDGVNARKVIMMIMSQ